MPNLQTLVSGILKIRPGEGQPVGYLFSLSFLTGMAMVSMETASTALFLGEHPIRALPIVYIVSAGITTLFGILYSRAEEYLSFNKLLIWTHGTVWVSVSLLGVSLVWLEHDVYTTRVLIVWFNVCAALTSIGFWGLANRILNVRQGKRLLGLIGAGEIAAGVIGGLAVSITARAVGAANLILFTSLFLGLGFILLIVIVRTLHGRIVITEDKPDTIGQRQEEGGLRNRYFMLILATASLSVFGYYVLDYVFYDRLETRFASNEDAIAGFLGIFIASIGIIRFLANTFLQSRLLERYGLSLGLLSVPVLMALGILSALVALAGESLAFFWIIIVGKTLDEVIRGALEEPSFRILHQPFPPLLRLRAQTAQETIVEPLASAAIGGLLILLTTGLGLESRHLLYGVCAILGLWILSAIALRREYTQALSQALDKRRLSVDTLLAGDKASIDFLRGKLKSSLNSEVINSLNMLEHFQYAHLSDDLLELLTHPHPDIRSHALERLADLKVARAGVAISRLLEIETDPQVVGAALNALCMVSEADAFDTVFGYLERGGVERRIQKGAMVGLLKNGGIDGILAAGTLLNERLASPEPKDRILAAQILGDVGIAGYYRPLMRLIQDADIAVRREAMRAASRLKSPRLLPHLLQHLPHPDLGSTASSAITAFGPGIIAYLEHAFAGEDQTRQLRIKLVRIIGKIGGAAAIQALKGKIDFPEEDVRKNVLASLVSCQYHATGAEAAVIRKQIAEEVRDATWTLSVLMDLGEGEDMAPLIRSLRGEVEKNRQRIFSLLALIYPSEYVLQSQLNLSTSSKDRRAKALEILDNLLSREIKEQVFPLLDDIAPAQRYTRLSDQFPQDRRSRHERLKELLARPHRWTTAWTKTCTLFAVGNIATREFYDAVISCLSDPDAVVRETAAWALGCLNPDDLPRRLTPVTHDPVERVASMARYILNTVGFACIPMGKSGLLTRSGRYSVDLFANMLNDEGERRNRRCRAAHILSRFPNSMARTALMSGLSISDKMVRTAVLDALVRGEYRVTEKDQNALLDLMNIEMKDAGRIVESLCVLQALPKTALLIGALYQEMNRTRWRILAILLLIYQTYIDTHGDRSTLVYWYGRGLKPGIPPEVSEIMRKIIAQARLEPDRAERIFDLLHEETESLRCRWQPTVQESEEAAVRHIQRIAFGSTTFTLSWSRVCAMDLIVRMQMKECVPRLIQALSDRDEVIRATAAWALQRLSPADFLHHAEALKCDTAMIVNQTTRQLLRQAG